MRHNFGHYNSVRHELLLVCTRGSCTPDNPKLYDSVQAIERSDTHSEKPGEFRDMIEMCIRDRRRCGRVHDATEDAAGVVYELRV